VNLHLTVRTMAVECLTCTIASFAPQAQAR